MSTPLAISCPHCGAGLKLKNNSFVGKKVPCPKCKKPFLVEEPLEDEFLAGDEDDFGAMDEPEEPSPKSKSKGAKGGKGKKKSKSGVGFAPIAMIAGGVVLGLGVIGGIIFGAMTLLSGMGSSSWVKWLPEDIDVAVQIRVADSINAPFFKPIADHPTLSKLMNQPPLPSNGGANPAAAFFQGLNIQAKDIDTITVGMVDGIQPGAASRFGGDQPPQIPKKFVAVIRLKTAVDAAKLAAAPANLLAKEDYNGKTVFAVANSANPKVLVHSVDSTTYLVGSDAELKGAIDRGGTAPASRRFAFANTKSSFIFVAAPQDSSKLKTLGITTFRKTSSGVQTENPNVDGIHGVSFGVTLGTDATMEYRSSLSASMAKATAEQGKKDLAQMRTEIQTQKAALDQAGFNPLVPTESLKKILSHVDAMFGTAQSTSSGSTATVTMTLSGLIVNDALAMAAPYMPMLESLVADQQKAAAAGAAASGNSTFGNSPLDITAYPGAVIDAGERTKSRAETLNDQHNADIEAAMQEDGAPSAPSPAAHGAPATAPPAPAIPNGVNPANVMHAAPAPAPAAGNAAGGNDPAKAMHAAMAPAPAAGNGAAANDPAKAMHAAAGAAPAGGGNAAGNGQNPDKPTEKPATKSKPRRRSS